MKYIKTLPYSIAFGATYAYLSVISRAFAQTNGGFGGDVGTGISGLATGDSDTAIRSSIENVVNAVLNFLALVAVVFVIVGGFRILAAGGNEENVTKGRKTIIYALVGLVVIFFAKVIIGFVTRVIGGTA